MSRDISVVLHGKDGPQDITRLVAEALDSKVKDRYFNAIRRQGCGMDMGFDLIYNLGRVLYPQGFDLVPGQRGRNGDTSGHDDDGGYALNQRWL